MIPKPFSFMTAGKKGLADQQTNPARLLPAADGKDTATGAFTLVEMLVSLAVLSIIFALVTNATHQFSAFRRLQRHSAMELAADQAGRLLARQIEGAMNIALIDNDHHSQIPMIGMTNDIRFVGTVQTGFRTFGLREVRVFLATGNEQSLMRSNALHRLGTGVSAPAADLALLAKGIVELSFEYATMDGTGKTKWQSSWNKTNALPEILRFTLVMAEDGDRVTIHRTVYLGSR